LRMGPHKTQPPTASVTDADMFSELTASSSSCDCSPKGASSSDTTSALYATSTEHERQRTTACVALSSPALRRLKVRFSAKAAWAVGVASNASPGFPQVNERRRRRFSVDTTALIVTFMVPPAAGSPLIAALQRSALVLPHAINRDVSASCAEATATGGNSRDTVTARYCVMPTCSV